MMGHVTTRPRRRRVKLVGGGYRYTREPNGEAGGSMKAERRRLRKLARQARLRKLARQARKAREGAGK